MSYCINPNCPKPQNSDNQLFCAACGSELLLEGQYRVLGQLGGGGFGTTYEVDDAGTAKVLKVLHLNEPKAISLFQQEAKVLEQLHHSGIPKVDPDGYFTFFTRGSQEPLHCLVMEKIEGKDLQEWLEKRGRPISQKLALKWLRTLVEILDEVHQKQFFHRDIKPPNIMLRPSGQLALIDFGTVKEITATYMANVNAGQPGTVIYSKGYAPTEQENGHTLPQSDFFALGRTFVHLLTGKHPLAFYDPHTDELNWRSNVPEISPRLADLIDELMGRLLSQRPANTQVILQRLAEIERALYPPPAPTPAPTPAPAPAPTPASTPTGTGRSQQKIKKTQSAKQNTSKLTPVKIILLLGLGLMGGVRVIVAASGLLNYQNNQAIKAKQSEAKQYVGSMNNSQQAYFIEKTYFADELDRLGLGIASQTENYNYSIIRVNEELALNYGVSRKDNLKSYVGGVFLGVDEDGVNTVFAILCEADYPGRITKPATPTYRNGRLACGEGTTEL